MVQPTHGRSKLKTGTMDNVGTYKTGTNQANKNTIVVTQEQIVEKEVDQLQKPQND